MPAKPILFVLALLCCLTVHVFGQKSNSSQKLIAVANYDYTLPSPGFVDSSRVFYSGSRGSKFEFDHLRYDWNNGGDYPPFANRLPPFEDRFGTIQYDSVLTYKSRSSLVYTLTGLRKYDSIGRIIDSRVGSLQTNAQRTIFLFQDTTLRYSMDLVYNPGLQKWDTPSYKSYVMVNNMLLNTYFFAWDGTKWVETGFNFYSNVNGFPLQEIDYRDSTLSPKYNNIFYQYNFTSAILYSKHQLYNNGKWLDSSWANYSYDGNVISEVRNYLWDSSSKSWVQKGQEYRFLNLQKQPDSIWSRSNYSGNWDTVIQKLSFNADKNPTRLGTYKADGTTLLKETRWYYDPESTRVSTIASNNDFEIFPSPALEKLYLKGNQISGNLSMRIVNLSGQTVLTGQASTSKPINISAFPAGVYVLQLWDAQTKFKNKIFQKL